MEQTKVLAAINSVQAAMVMQGGISKDRKNSAQGYSFRGIDDCFNEFAPLLAKAKLICIPSYSERSVVEREGRNGGALFYVTVKGDFTFRSAEDGSEIKAGPFYGEAMDSGDKATNKAMSAAMKYCFLQTFTVPTEGDNDSENQTHEVKHAALRKGDGNGKITPASGMLDSLEIDLQNDCMDVAHRVERLFAKGDVGGATDEWEQESARLNKMSEFAKGGTWNLMDSKVRAAIKAEQLRRNPQLKKEAA